MDGRKADWAKAENLKDAVSKAGGMLAIYIKQQRSVKLSYGKSLLIPLFASRNQLST
jgi:hypothetical protein